jgi:hypothetical protein
MFICFIHLLAIVLSSGIRSIIHVQMAFKGLKDGHGGRDKASESGSMTSTHKVYQTSLAVFSLVFQCTVCYI